MSRENLPVRRRNRLEGFDYSTPGAYFITICTDKRRNLLCQIVGGGALDAPQVELTEAGEIVKKYILSGNQMPGITVDKYVIMPNHIHIIVFVERVVEGADPYGINVTERNQDTKRQADTMHAASGDTVRRVVEVAQADVNSNTCPAASTPLKQSDPYNAQIPRFVGALKRFCRQAAGKQLFQRSYHDHVIRGEKDYLKIWQYIDTNPVKWKEDCFYNEE